jgi:hypothetical protein
MDLRVVGARSLERKLLKLNMQGPWGKKRVRFAVTKGAAVVRKEGRKNARTVVGGNMGALLAKNIVSQVYKKQRSGSYARWIGMRPDVDEFVSPTKGSVFINNVQVTGRRNYIPAAIEYGHAAPGQGGTGVKIVPAMSFLRAAVDTHGKEARRVTLQEIKRGIEQEFRVSR